MAEPVTIIGKIHLSEQAFNKFLNSKPYTYDKFNDWKKLDFIHQKWKQIDLKLESANTGKSFYANALIDIENSEYEDDLMLFYFDTQTEQLIYIRTYRFDWFATAQTELLLLRQLAHFKDTDSEDCALIASLFPYESSVRDIKSMLIFKKQDSYFESIENFTNEQLSAIKLKFTEQYLAILSLVPAYNYSLPKESWVKSLKQKQFIPSSVFNEYQKIKKQNFSKNLPELIAKASSENPLYIYKKDIYTDGKNVYGFSKRLLEDADPLTIRKEGRFILDKKNVYCLDGFALRNNQLKIEGANAAYFKLYRNTFFKDNAETDYWQDDRHVYYAGNKLTGAIPDTCSFIGRFFISGAFVFLEGKQRDDIEIATLKMFDLYYYANKGKVYTCVYQENLVPHADASSFQLLEYPFYKDEGDVLDLDFMCKDDFHVYYHDKIVEDANPKTFKRLDKVYSIDKNFVYIKGEIQPDSHAPSFTIDLPFHFARDKNQIYYQKIIEGADVETFEVIGESAYAKDKNHIYFMNEKLYNVDRVSFKVLAWCEALDKEGRIYYSKRSKEN